MSRPRPNIVLVHGHDVGRWIGAYRRRGPVTPALDALAASSIVFDRAFAAAPLCSPARGSIFTGLLPHQHGLMGLVHHSWRYRSDIVTMPELLTEAGYRTAIVGLQHENVDANVIGFTEVLSGGFLPRALPTADVAAGWLADADASGDQRPFLLTVGFWEAHRPWPAEDYTPVPAQDIDVPAYLPDTEGTREDLAHFLGAVRQLDEAVGRIMDVLDATRFASNTIVVFTTDHGAAFPRAKSTLYDSGVEVALLIRPPAVWGLPPGRRDGLVSHVDLLPTFLELAQSQVPETLVGRSLVADLASPVGADRELYLEKTYHDAYDPLRAVRTERHKYIRSYANAGAAPVPQDIAASATYRSADDWSALVQPPEALYDLDSDPDELVNIAGVAEHQPVLQDMARRMEAWMVRTADPLLDGEVPLPPMRTRGVDALPVLDPRNQNTPTRKVAQ